MAQRKKLRGGVILQLFSRLSKFFIALLSRKRAAKLRVSERVKACLHAKRTKAVSRSKAPAQRFTIQTKLCVHGRFVFAVVVFTRQIRERSNSLCTFTMQRCFPNAQTSSVLFPRLPLTTTHAHTVPFLGDYSCNEFRNGKPTARVIRR